MEENEILREQLFEIVNNQLKANDPPETKITYDRLIKEGFDDYQAKQMIAFQVGCRFDDFTKSQICDFYTIL